MSLNRDLVIELRTEKIGVNACANNGMYRFAFTRGMNGYTREVASSREQYRCETKALLEGQITLKRIRSMDLSTV